MNKDKLKKFFQNSKAFTLIELLVVVAIIGILVTIVIIAINPVKLLQDARDSTRRSDLQQLKASMQLYYNECKKYPPAASLDFATPEAFDDEDSGSSCDNSTTYMKQLPKETGAVFTYTTDATQTNYEVTARLYTRGNDDTNALNKCASTISGAYVDGSEADYVICND